MKLQDSKANCGPVALANALESMGHIRSVDEMSKLCRTSATNGTSPASLVKAVATLKEPCDLRESLVIKSNNSVGAWAVLAQAVQSGRAAVLLVDGGDHYVSVVGLQGLRAIVVDSADEGLIVVADEEELMDWWHAGGRFPYWGVVL